MGDSHDDDGEGDLATRWRTCYVHWDNASAGAEEGRFVNVEVAPDGGHTLKYTQPTNRVKLHELMRSGNLHIFVPDTTVEMKRYKSIHLRARMLPSVVSFAEFLERMLEDDDDSCLLCTASFASMDAAEAELEAGTVVAAEWERAAVATTDLGEAIEKAVKHFGVEFVISLRAGACCICRRVLPRDDE